MLTRKTNSQNEYLDSEFWKGNWAHTEYCNCPRFVHWSFIVNRTNVIASAFIGLNMVLASANAHHILIKQIVIIFSAFLSPNVPLCGGSIPPDSFQKGKSLKKKWVFAWLSIGTPLHTWVLRTVDFLRHLKAFHCRRASSCGDSCKVVSARSLGLTKLWILSAKVVRIKGLLTNRMSF